MSLAIALQDVERHQFVTELQVAMLGGNSIDRMLADDAWRTHRERMSSIFERSTFAHLSDVELACAYTRSIGAENDAIYCELHLRQLTPWKILEAADLLEVSP